MNWKLLLSYWALLLGLGLWFCLSLGAASLYQSWSGSHCSKGVLALGISVMRQRYGLIMCVAPAALGIVAWWQPHMLQALLLAREDNAYWDIFKITLISIFTVGVGMAQCRLVILNGDARFTKVESLLSSEVQPTVPFTGTAAPATRNASSSTPAQSEDAAPPVTANKNGVPGWSWCRFVWW